MAGQALTTAPRAAYAHFSKAQVLRAQRRYADAIPEYEAALSANANWVTALHFLAYCKLYTGLIEEAIQLDEQNIRLSRRDPAIFSWYRQIGLVHLAQSRTSEAVIWLEKARSTAPVHPNVRAQLAAACALAGKPERAAAEFAEARRLSGDDRYSSLARLRAVENYEGMAPELRALFETAYYAGLHKAGVPEE